MSSVPERFRIIGIKNTGLLDGPQVILALRDLTADILVRVGADFVEDFCETGFPAHAVTPVADGLVGQGLALFRILVAHEVRYLVDAAVGGPDFVRALFCEVVVVHDFVDGKYSAARPQLAEPRGSHPYFNREQYRQ